MQIRALALKLLPPPRRYSAASNNFPPEEQPARPLLSLPPSHKNAHVYLGGPCPLGGGCSGP